MTRIYRIAGVAVELLRLPLLLLAYAVLDVAGYGHWLDAFAHTLPRRGRFYYTWMGQVFPKHPSYEAWLCPTKATTRSEPEPSELSDRSWLPLS